MVETKKEIHLAVAVVEEEPLFTGPQSQTALRVTAYQDKVVLDLGSKLGWTAFSTEQARYLAGDIRLIADTIDSALANGVDVYEALQDAYKGEDL